MIIERRLDMSFQTERPKSTAEMIAELKESKLERKSNRKALLENYNAKKLSDDRQSVLEATQAETEEKALTEEHIESIRDRRREERAVKEASLNRLTLLESAKKITMNKVLFEMVYDAYWLDDNVKRESIQETYNEYRNVLGLVENVCGGSKTKDGDKTEFIKNVESVVEEACKKAVDRIIKEQKESGEPTKEFEFTSEEESYLDKKLSELGRDEIVDLVKKKVLTVVQDERKSGKEKAEMLKELDKTEDDQSSEDESDSGDMDKSDDESDINSDENEEETVEEGVIGDDITKWFNKMKKSANHIRYTHKSNSTKRIGTDSEIEAAIRVYDKYSSTKFKRKDLQFIVLTQSNPKFEKMCELVTDIDPERVFSIMNISYTPDKIIIASLIIYDLNDNGDGDCTISFCPNYGITDDDKFYLMSILLNRYHGTPKSISYTNDFTDLVKNKYPEEMNSMIKKTVTEGVAYDSDFEPVEEGIVGFFKHLKSRNIALKKVLVKLPLQQVCSPIAKDAIELRKKGDYNGALKKYREFIASVQGMKKQADKIISDNNYDSEVKTELYGMLDYEISEAKKIMAEIQEEKKKKPVSENYQVALESMIAQKQRRTLRNSMGGTLFESFMIANSNSIRDEAIMEGVDIDTASAMNAALIESILQYTVLETLNTTKLYNFTSSDVMKIKAHNRSTLRN